MSSRLLLAVLLLGAPLARAQHVLLVQHKGKPHVVVAAAGTRVAVEDKGKRVYVNADRFALVDAPEYLPVFISVRQVRAKTSYVQVADTGSAINNQFEFHASFESPYALEDVFLVLALNLEQGRSLFVYEIGRLDPHHPRTLNLFVPVSGRLGEGHYQLHLFAGGHEVLHSGQPFDYREAVLDRMIAKRVASLPDAPPQPFVGPTPEYPEKLYKDRVKGRAVVRLQIRPNGAVQDPELVEASDPAFGASAVAALRQWRFLPRIKGGHPVATSATMPIDFTPPEENSKAP